MNGKGQALSLHKLVEPGPARNHPGPDIYPCPSGAGGTARAPWHCLPVPPAKEPPKPRKTKRPQGSLDRRPPRQRRRSGSGPRAPTPARCRKTNRRSWCGQPGLRAAGARASGPPRARPAAAFQSLFCHRHYCLPRTPPPPPGRCHLPGGAFLTAVPARPRHDPGRLAQGSWRSRACV